MAPTLVHPPCAAAAIIDAAALYVEDGSAPDDFDQTPAEAFAGRFACHLCADNRDACERAESELKRLQAQLAKAHALLRTLRRLEPKPARAEGLDDDPEALAAVAHAVYIATLRARIDHYFQAARP